MVNDVVSDSIIRIKNGYMAREVDVVLPYSKLVLAICSKLVENGYIKSYSDEKQSVVAQLVYKNKRPAVLDVRRVSKPGRRVYVGKSGIKNVLSGSGISILSTPIGVLTNKEARDKNVGGEVLFEVW